MLRLIGSIIGALLDHCHGRCVRLEAWRTGPKPPVRFSEHNPWCATFVAQVPLAWRFRMPLLALRCHHVLVMSTHGGKSGRVVNLARRPSLTPKAVIACDHLMLPARLPAVGTSATSRITSDNQTSSSLSCIHQRSSYAKYESKSSRAPMITIRSPRRASLTRALPQLPRSGKANAWRPCRSISLISSTTSDTAIDSTAEIYGLWHHQNVIIVQPACTKQSTKSFLIKQIGL